MTRQAAGVAELAHDSPEHPFLKRHATLDVMRPVNKFKYALSQDARRPADDRGTGPTHPGGHIRAALLRRPGTAASAHEGVGPAALSAVDGRAGRRDPVPSRRRLRPG